MKKTDEIVLRHKNMLLQKTTMRDTKNNTVSSLFSGKLAMSATELALVLGVSPRTVERMLKRGEIQYKKIGRRVVIPIDAVETWLNQKD